MGVGAGHVVVASASAAGDGRVDAMLATFAVMTSEQVGVSGDGDGHVVEDVRRGRRSRTRRLSTGVAVAVVMSDVGGRATTLTVASTELSKYRGSQAVGEGNTGT